MALRIVGVFGLWALCKACGVHRGERNTARSRGETVGAKEQESRRRALDLRGPASRRVSPSEPSDPSIGVWHPTSVSRRSRDAQAVAR